jgi:hypothetical protein
MRKFTWNDLAEKINELTSEQRESQVYMSFDDENRFRRIESLETIPEDVYVNKHDDEDSGSLEDLKSAWQEDFKKSDYRLSTKKGTPFLWDGF